MAQTLLFLGATGGVANSCLTLVLKSKAYKVIALVRSPDKLRKQLLEQQNLNEATVNNNLSIIQGNALDHGDVKRALLANISSGISKTLPSMIISGVGPTPVLQFDFRHPLQIARADQPTICEDSAKTVIAALKEIHAEQPSLSTSKPDLCFVSTTGISRGIDDVPFSMRFLYHQILALPHVDKKKMENTYRDHMLESEPVFSSVTGIRPTLLLGTGAIKEAVGLNKIRVGVESKPATGFTIQRADVGTFVFENVVKEAGERRWRGEMVSLTS